MAYTFSDISKVDDDTISTSSKTEVSSSDYTIRDAVGSTSGIETSLDPETQDATQRIGSKSDTGTTITPEAEEDVSVDTGSGGLRSIMDQTRVEQAIEDVTEGAAFLNPEETDTISDRETWSFTEAADQATSAADLAGIGGGSGLWGNKWVQLAAVGLALWVAGRMLGVI